MERKYFPSENTNNLYCEMTRIACYTALGYHGLKRERRHTQSHQPPSKVLCRLFVHVHVAEAPTTSDVEPGHLLYRTHPPACLPPPPTLPAHLPSLFCLFLPLLSLHSLHSGIFIINVIAIITVQA